MRFLARWGVLFAGTGAAVPFVASLVGRLALGSAALAIVLDVRHATGSYADGGLVAAAYAISFAVAAPRVARAADRRGARPVLRILGVVHPLALVALLAATSSGLPGAALVVPAIVAGAAVPPFGPVSRAMWTRLVAPDVLPVAYNLEAIAVELCFVLGPLLAASLAALDPPLALVGTAVVSVVGAQGLAASPVVRAQEPHPTDAAAPGSPLRSPVVRRLLLTLVAMGSGFGVIEVAIPATVTQHHHSTAVSGVLLATWSLGSIVGGLIYSAVHPTQPAHVQLPVLVTALALGSALPSIAPGLLALGLLLLAYGTTIAPYSTVNSILLSSSAPPGTIAETFAWSSTAIFGGASIGNAVAGIVSDQASPRTAMALAAATGALVLASGWSSRRVLRPV